MDLQVEEEFHDFAYEDSESFDEKTPGEDLSTAHRETHQAAKKIMNMFIERLVRYRQKYTCIRKRYDEEVEDNQRLENRISNLKTLMRAKLSMQEYNHKEVVVRLQTEITRQARDCSNRMLNMRRECDARIRLADEEAMRKVEDFEEEMEEKMDVQFLELEDKHQDDFDAVCEAFLDQLEELHDKHAT